MALHTGRCRTDCRSRQKIPEFLRICRCRAMSDSRSHWAEHGWGPLPSSDFRPACAHVKLMTWRLRAGSRRAKQICRAGVVGLVDIDSKASGGTESPGSITALIDGLGRCDPAAIAVLWQRFFPRLTGVAQRTLRELPRCNTDADDVAQSAFLSFWQALEGGRSFEFADRHDLWNLLGLVTVRKARKLVRADTAQKRGGGRRRQASGDISTDEDLSLNQRLAAVSPAEFDLFCEEMLLKLDDESRRIATLRLQGNSTSEIAELLGLHQRAIQRSLEATRDLWQSAADDG